MRLEFDAIHNDLLREIETARQALEMLKESRDLPRILDVILQIGKMRSE